MIHPKHKEILILLLCLIIGFALRFYTFDKKSLWIDEVYTFNDSRYALSDQIKYFKETPQDLLHPPLFFLLNYYLFYPFPKPERDLRIIPLISGILSIPMIYILSRSFSPYIAIPCTICLTFMTYHISFSQEGRPYSLIMFLGMIALYFFLKHLKTSGRGSLFLVAFLFGIMFYTSYASIPFIAFSQLLWLYHVDEEYRRKRFSSFLTLNIITLLLWMPWVIFLGLNYKGQPVIDIFSIQDPGPLWAIAYRILSDWIPLEPLMAVSIILLILLPIFMKNRKNALIFLSTLFIPVAAFFLLCRLFNFRHYFSSKYLINFLPLFFIALFLSLNAIEIKFEKLKKFFRLQPIFILLFIASNLVILPLYYQFEKQDFRGLVSYLNEHLRDGDKIHVRSIAQITGMLHYFKVKPESRHHKILVWWNPEKTKFESVIPLAGPHKNFSIIFSNYPLNNYIADGNRLWIILGTSDIEVIQKQSPGVLKAYFDGSFANFMKFPSDASMYLFLWDPKSPDEKGIDLPLK